MTWLRKSCVTRCSHSVSGLPSDRRPEMPPWVVLWMYSGGARPPAQAPQGQGQGHQRSGTEHWSSASARCALPGHGNRLTHNLRGLQPARCRTHMRTTHLGRGGRRRRPL